MEKQTIPAEVRTLRGKGPARQLRMKGQIPAVLYGPGGETQVLAVDPTLLTKALTTKYHKNQLLELDLGGAKQFAVIKELDIHPVSRVIRHADFYRVSLDRASVYEIPLKTTGRAKGVVKGGEVRVHFRTIPVKVTPDKVPDQIMINVENLDMMESVRVKDVQLEHGTIELPAERAIVHCTAEIKKIVEEEGTPGAAGAAGASVAPAAAAPAAKAAAKPAGKKCARAGVGEVGPCISWSA
jgi:large subunit ribosomal protein L25